MSASGERQCRSQQTNNSSHPMPSRWRSDLHEFRFTGPGDGVDAALASLI
jgi:hypothetical protein